MDNELKERIYPLLPYEEWADTKETLHLYTQVAGKVMLALEPRKNHWWYITYRITPRGISSIPIPYNYFTFEISFDLIDHKVTVRTSRGDVDHFELYDGLSVADFYHKLMSILHRLRIEIEINATPYGVKSTIPFAEDNTHKSYKKDFVQRYHEVLIQVDAAFKEFSGRFNGKCSPVQLFWHSFDIAVTRFSGKEAGYEGGKMSDREAYSHEVISAGFWPGDDNVPEPSFYSYTAPSPEGLDKEPLKPQQAKWNDSMALLSYHDLRKENDPKAALLDFLESTYLAGAKRAGWDIERFKVRELT